MKVKQSSPAMCPKCGHTFAFPGRLGMSGLKRVGKARVRALDKVELLAELKAVRDSRDDMLAKISRLRKHDLTLHRMANVERLGREQLRESLDDARARLQKLRKEAHALLTRLRKLRS